MLTLEQVLRATQKDLAEKIREEFAKDGVSLPILAKNKYLYVCPKQDTTPFLLVAHLDTVHHDRVKTICQSDNILMSPQGIGGDDRCGVYSLLYIYKNSPIHPYLLFTFNEEVGGLGALAFCDDFEKGNFQELKSVKCIIELDRKGKNDAVYYEDTNEVFQNYITSKGFKTQFGSFSDISYIAPTLNISAVNLSIGYHNPHTVGEYINLKQMYKTIEKVINIIKETEIKQFTYKRRERQIDYFKDNAFLKYDDYNLAFSKTTTKKPKLHNELEEQAYFELLDLYDEEELNDIIETMGSDFLLDLYKTDILGEK